MTVKRKLPTSTSKTSTTAPGAGVKPVGRMRDRAKIKKEGGVLLPELKKVALAEFNDHSHSTDHIYPSEMARSDWCPRATYYRISTGVVIDEDFSFTLESIFDEGHSVEQKWQRRMRQTGKLWGVWRCICCGKQTGNELEPLMYDQEHDYTQCYGHLWEYKEVALEDTPLRLRGREDGAMGYPGYLVEIKTIGPGTVRRDAPKLMAQHYYKDIGVYDYDSIWKDLRRPFVSHIRQTNIYLYMARSMGLDFSTAVLLYEFKSNQQTKEFTVKLTPSIYEPLLDKAQSIVDALDGAAPVPACPFDGQDEDTGCAKCKVYEHE